MVELKDREQEEFFSAHDYEHEQIERKKAATTFAVGGIAVAGGVAGMLHFEAETTEDAVATISLGNETITHIVPEDIPFGVLALGGALAVSLALQKLRSLSHKND
jgi:hypothetical protein